VGPARPPGRRGPAAARDGHIDGFAGTSVADLAGVLGVSKAAIYYHYRSKNALLHHLVDPLLDAIDACIHGHSAPNRPAPGARQLLDDYLAVLTAQREVVPLVATDVAVLTIPRSALGSARRTSGSEPCWSPRTQAQPPPCAPRPRSERSGVH
jgi:AcrR family transcriptional regulator